MLGERIKQCREMNDDMQAQQLAKMMNVTKSTISSWESGNSSPKPSQIKELSDILHVPTDYLLEAGVFGHWEEVKDHRTFILRQISSVMREMSYDILEGIDELTYIRLLNAFNVKITTHDDGIGVSVDSLFPTYSDSVINPVRQEDDDWLSLIHSLGADGQRQLKGYIDCLIQIQSSELKQAK